MATVTLYSGAAGINNKVPAHRLQFSAETGVSALEGALDVLIDRTGELVTRRGVSNQRSASNHSLYPGNTWGLVAEDRDNDTALMQVSIDNDGEITFTGLWAGLTKGARIDYCEYNNQILFCNGHGIGAVDKASVSVVAWPESEWPTDTNVGFVLPPNDMSHLCSNAGRIYFSVGSSVFYTEFGHPGIYDPSANRENFESKILMLFGVSDGLYVSDSDGIYFLSGLDPHKWHARKVADYPAKEWGRSFQDVDPSFFGLESNAPAVMVATANGPLLCMAGGQVVNLIDKSVTMPACASGAAIVVIDETLVIQGAE